MDSVTALYHCCKNYTVSGALSFAYGSKHNKMELPLAAFHCRKLNVKQDVVNLKFIPALFRSVLLLGGGRVPDGHYQSASMKSTVVPFRNGIFLSIAGGYAESVGADAVVIGAHGGDHAIYPDCRKKFMLAMNDAMRLGTYRRIRIIFPFIAITKSAIVSKGRELAVDYAKTWSCYKGGLIHCGKCGTCTERREAFALAGMQDPTKYKTVGFP